MLAAAVLATLFIARKRFSCRRRTGRRTSITGWIDLPGPPGRWVSLSRSPSTALCPEPCGSRWPVDRAQTGGR